MKKYLFVVICSFIINSITAQQNTLELSGNIVAAKEEKGGRCVVTILKNKKFELYLPSYSRAIKIDVKETERLRFKNAPSIIYDFTSVMPHDFKWENLAVIDLRKLNKAQRKLIVGNFTDTGEDFIIFIIGKPSLRILANITKDTNGFLSKKKIINNNKQNSNSNNNSQTNKAKFNIKKPTGTIINKKHTAKYINSLFLETGTEYTKEDQERFSVPAAFPTYEGNYEGNDLFGLLGRHIEDPAVIGFINHYRLKKFGNNRYFKFQSVKTGIWVKFDKNKIKSIQLKMNGGIYDGNYTGKLPFGILRTDTKTQVISKMPANSLSFVSWAELNNDDYNAKVQIP